MYLIFNIRHEPESAPIPAYNRLIILSGDQKRRLLPSVYLTNNTQLVINSQCLL